MAEVGVRKYAVKLPPGESKMLLDPFQGHFVVRKSGNTHIGLPVVQFGWIPICYIRIYTSQGVVTYMSPVEAFVTRIKIFDQQKCA